MSKPVTRDDLYLEIKSVRQDIEELKAQNLKEHKETNKLVAENKSDIEDILKWIAKSKGFLGGITLMLGAFWAILVFLKSAILKLMEL